MRRALAAGLLWCALAAHAQAPPEAAPAPSPQAAPAAPPQEEPAAAPASAPQPSPAVMTQEQAEQPAPRPPAPVRTPVARPQASSPRPEPAAAPPHPPAERDQLIAQLRGEVNRLQSELDAEHAAAVQPAEEGAAQQHNAWGWLMAVALAGLAAGFVLGWRLLDRRIRRKYGGLRIY